MFFVYLSVIFPCLSAVFRISGNSLDPRSLTYLPVDFVTVLSLLSLRSLSLNFKSQMVNVGGVSEFAQSFLPMGRLPFLSCFVDISLFSAMS